MPTNHINAVMIAPNWAIADTGATSIFIKKGANVANRCITLRPLIINQPDCSRIKSTHVCDIHIPGLPQKLMGHIVLFLAVASLIGIRPLCKAGCTVIFNDCKCDVVYNGSVILQGHKDPSTDLWTLLLPNSVCSAPE